MSSKSLFHQVKKANLKYRMIESDDRIAVGVSGGKDSLILLYALNLLKEYTPLIFDVVPISIDLGWDMDWQRVTDYCHSLLLPHHIIKTNIGHVVFHERQEKNPCALCANLRSGSLHRHAVELGCNKVALAHHLDDAVTTLMMSMMFEGQFRTFKPVTYLDKTGVILIRPLIYVEEKTIINLVQAHELPVVSNPCPVTGRTNREAIKNMIEAMEEKYPHSRRRMLLALENVNWDSFWITEHLF